MLETSTVTGGSTRPQPPVASLGELKRASRWLSEFAANVTSQNGEDGIVAKALSILPNRDHWCAEFGAWDGKFASNTYDLVDRQNYRAVLIEGDAGLYGQLQSSYPHKDRAIMIRAYVGWSSSDSLDHILERHPIPRDFDFLSIDIDGNDYYVWRAMNGFRPKLLLIEFNFTMANAVDFTQPADAHCQQGSSPAALVKLAKEKGYELIAVTWSNLLFVDRAYYSLFGIPDNSLEVMRDEPPNYVSFGYDGTVLLHGRCALEWHPGLRLEASKIQVLPRMLRSYQSNYTFTQKCAFRLLFLWTHPKEGLQRIQNYVKRKFQRESARPA
jgi:hypothetical protein